MILDRTWNKRDRKLTISYINKLGKRGFYTKYLGYMKTYEYDDEGDILTWNDRKCKEVYKDTSTYKPNEFDILEYLYELPEDMKKRFYAQNFPLAAIMRLIFLPIRPHSARFTNRSANVCPNLSNGESC